MAKKKKQAESGAAEAGIRVLTVALFIILLAFFIVLNSIAVIDDRRKLEALGSLTGSFGILPGGLSAMQGEGESITPQQAPILKRDTEASEFGAVDSNLAAAGRVFRQSSPTGEIVSIQDLVLFGEGSHQIKPSSFGLLNEISTMIKQSDYPVDIIGHTDNRPPEETEVRSNWALSALRALEVLKYFIVIGKVKPTRLTAYGVAEHSPIASNETRQSRARNNRVDIVFNGKSYEMVKRLFQNSPRPSPLVVFKRFVFRIFE